MYFGLSGRAGRWLSPIVYSCLDLYFRICFFLLHFLVCLAELSTCISLAIDSLWERMSPRLSVPSTFLSMLTINIQIQMQIQMKMQIIMVKTNIQIQTCRPLSLHTFVPSPIFLVSIITFSHFLLFSPKSGCREEPCRLLHISSIFQQFYIADIFT